MNGPPGYHRFSEPCGSGYCGARGKPAHGQTAWGQSGAVGLLQFVAKRGVAPTGRTKNLPDVSGRSVNSRTAGGRCAHRAQREAARSMALLPGVTMAHLGASGWPAGDYRIMLTYNSSDECMGGAGGAVHSADFTVG